MIGALLEDPSDSGIGVLGVLSNHHEVDVIGALALEGAELLRKKADRSEIDEQIEIESQSGDDGSFHQPHLDSWIPDGAEIDRIHTTHLIEDLIGQQFSRFQVVLTAVRIGGSLDLKVAHFCDGIEHLEGHLSHLGPDSVTGKHCDLVIIRHDSSPLMLSVQFGFLRPRSGLRCPDRLRYRRSLPRVRRRGDATRATW